jgi:hypothetical protein
LSGETEKQVSGWTVDTLKAHFEAIIAGNDVRYDQRFAAQESAAKYAQEKSNEFRGSLDDIGKKQMPRAEAEALIRSISEKIDLLQARLDRNEGRSGGLSSGWGYLIGAIGLIGSLVAIVLALRR